MDRVYDLQRRLAMQERAELRSAAQGTGDRSDKVRTYNFPQVRYIFWLVCVCVFVCVLGGGRGVKRVYGRSPLIVISTAHTRASFILMGIEPETVET